MKGRIYRVTYNAVKQVAELHMDDETIKEVPMNEDTWGSMLCGDVVSNFSKFLDE